MPETVQVAEPKEAPGALELYLKQLPKNLKTASAALLKGLPFEEWGIPHGELVGSLASATQGVFMLSKARRLHHEEEQTGCYAFSDEKRNEAIFRFLQAAAQTGVVLGTRHLHLSPMEAKELKPVLKMVPDLASIVLEFSTQKCALIAKKAAEEMRKAHELNYAFCIPGAIGPACHYPRPEFGQRFIGNLFGEKFTRRVGDFLRDPFGNRHAERS